MLSGLPPAVLDLSSRGIQGSLEVVSVPLSWVLWDWQWAVCVGMASRQALRTPVVARASLGRESGVEAAYGTGLPLGERFCIPAFPSCCVAPCHVPGNVAGHACLAAAGCVRRAGHAAPLDGSAGVTQGVPSQSACGACRW